MSLFHSPSLVTSGLVLCLDAGNAKSYPGSGTTWTDLSGNGNTGTLTNGPTYSSANGGSIVFDGVNDYVGLTAGLLSGTGDFTVSQWIQSSSIGSGIHAFGNYPAGNLQMFFASSAVGMWLGNSSAYANEATHYTASWVMFTCLRSGTVTQVYKNETLIQTGSSDSTIGGTGAAFRLGGNTNNVEWYTGKIGTTNVYNRALSAAEVKQNFNALRGRYGV